MDKEYFKKHYQKNKETYNKRSAAWRRNQKFKDPQKYICTKIRNRAKARGFDFDLQPEDITIPPSCPILGMPLFFSLTGSTENSPSVDRVDNTKGYIKGNIKIISRKANRLKGDLSAEQIKRLLDYVTS